MRNNLTKYTVKIKKGMDGYYVAQCLELSAAISQGKTKTEALKNIKEAIELVLEDIKEEAQKKRATVIEVEV